MVPSAISYFLRQPIQSEQTQNHVCSKYSFEVNIMQYYTVALIVLYCNFCISHCTVEHKTLHNWVWQCSWSWLGQCSWSWLGGSAQCSWSWLGGRARTLRSLTDHHAAWAEFLKLPGGQIFRTFRK